jgi:hypothetical protein
MIALNFLRPPRWLKWLLVTLVPLAAVGFFLHGLGLLGRWSRGQLRAHDRFQVAWTDIDCAPPASLSPAEFLSEVQYLAGQPDQLPVLEEDLPRTLAAAFSQHPWVEAVRRVEVLPGRKVRVELAYRVPILAVLYNRHKRAVDAAGILLPVSAPTSELPVFGSLLSPHRGGPGTKWDDATLRSAARLVAFLRASDVPRFAQVESAANGLVLTTPAGSRVFWGPFTEGDDAVRKRNRLVEYCGKYGDLDHPHGPREHNLLLPD